MNATGIDSFDSPTSCVRAMTVSSPSAKRSWSGVERWIITDGAADDVEQLQLAAASSSYSNVSGSSCR